MSAHTNKQGVNTTTVEVSSPPKPSVSPAEPLNIPDTMPTTEITLFRDQQMVLRLRPIPDSDELCLSMYHRLTEATQHLIPERSSTRRKEHFEASPNTISALPDTLQDRYITAVNQLTEQFDLSIVHPTTGDGICHRRHDTLGKYGIVSFETRLA